MEKYPEPKLLGQVTTRVHDRLPDVTVEAVEEQVVALFDEYADSKVRDFVPILVEREAVVRLMPGQRDAARLLAAHLRAYQGEGSGGQPPTETLV